MERQWRWKWAGLPWKRSDGLDYYDAVVQVDPTNRSASRTFRRGDAVCVNGDGGFDKSVLWVAQILDFIQVNDDSKLGDVELEEEPDPVQKKYTRMRCTLRWFYSETDIESEMLKKAGLPEPAIKEFYFTDDVEVPGFNDIQVIEGRAWLVDDEEARMRFISNPDPMYAESCDSVCIVRGYISSQLGMTRRLCPGELRRLLLATSGAPMFLDSFQEITGRSFGSSRRSRASTSQALPASNSPGHSAASVAKVKSHQHPDQSDDNFAASDHLSDDHDEPGSDESDIAEVSSETRSRRKSKVSEVAKNTEDEDDDNAVDAVERAKFRKRYTHTGRHRVRFNREERDDGSDYENDVDARDGHYEVAPGSANRVLRLKRRPASARKENELPDLDRRGKGESHSKPRRRRAPESDLDSHPRTGGDSNRRSSGPSTKSSKSLPPSSRRTKTSKSLNHKTASRPSRPGEQHLSMFRSLESAKHRETTVVVVGPEEEPSGTLRRSGSSDKLPVPNPDDEYKTFEQCDEDNVLLSKLFPGSPSTGAGTESSPQRSMDRSREVKITQRSEAIAKTQEGQASVKRADAESSNSDDSEAMLSNTRNVHTTTNSGVGPRRYTSAPLSGCKTVEPARKERAKRLKSLEKGRGDLNKVEIDKSERGPIKTGRKRVLVEDSSDDDTTGNLAIDQTELERLFGKLSEECKRVAVLNRDTLAEEAVRQFDIKSKEGKLSGETMVDEIAKAIAKQLTLY